MVPLTRRVVSLVHSSLCPVAFFTCVCCPKRHPTRVYGCHSLLPLFPLICLGHQWPVLFLQQVLSLDNNILNDIYLFFTPQMALIQNVSVFVFQFFACNFAVGF